MTLPLFGERRRERRCEAAQRRMKTGKRRRSITSAVALTEFFFGHLPSFSRLLGVLKALRRARMGFETLITGYTEFSWVTMGCTGLEWVIVGLTGFHWVELDYTR